jgi:Leucine-rich repeat (LRR) protein
MKNLSFLLLFLCGACALSAQRGHEGISFVSEEEYAADDVNSLNDQVTNLNLSDRKLIAIPEEVLRHLPLKTLLLSGNQITALPAEIGALTNLAILDLSKNRLNSLPAEIGALSNLRHLKLSGNPIPPSELAKIRELLPA